MVLRFASINIIQPYLTLPLVHYITQTTVQHKTNSIRLSILTWDAAAESIRKFVDEVVIQTILQGPKNDHRTSVLDFKTMQSQQSSLPINNNHLTINISLPGRIGFGLGTLIWPVPRMRFITVQLHTNLIVIELIN